MSQIINQNDTAVAAAMAVLDEPLPGPIKFIDYEVRRCLLLIGPAVPVFEMARSLRHQFDVVAVINEPRPESRLIGVSVISAQQVELSGYLGQFSVSAKDEDGKPIDLGQKSTNEDGYFDLVLDLSSSPILNHAVPPLGYLRPADRDQYQAVLADIPLLSGEFQKPKYFNFDPELCVHSRQQLAGCDRCLKVCPAEAIMSGVRSVSVEPHLCRGCGSCTAVCPTGAFGYTDPPVSAITDRLVNMLRAYEYAGGSFNSNSPWVGFHDNGCDQQKHWASENGIILLPFPLHAPGMVSLELLLAPLALGAAGVVLAVSEKIPAMVIDMLSAQVALARVVLTQLGYDRRHIQLLLDGDEGTESIESLPLNSRDGDEEWSYPGDKDPHSRLLSLFGRLSLHSDQLPEVDEIELPNWSMFGTLELDTHSCTMCLACTSLCPVGALQSVGHGIELKFLESSCIQCGLCEDGCPEDAIKRRPRFYYQALINQELITLNRTTMASCIECGKPFMSDALLTAAMKHLVGDSDEILHAQRMLKVCPQCRASSTMHAQFPEITGDINN